MNYWTKAFFTFLCCSFLSLNAAFGQTKEVEKINEFWTGVSLKYKLNKKIAFNVDQQVRITDNLNSIRQTFFEFGARYKFNKHFSTKLQHRYIIPNGERHINRVSLDGTGEWEIKPIHLEFAYRLRFQHGITTYTKEPETYLRNRFQVRYRIVKGLKVFAQYESFYQFNDKSRFRRNLFAAGFDFRVNKKMDLSVFYRLDVKINSKNPFWRNTVGVLVEFEI